MTSNSILRDFIDEHPNYYALLIDTDEDYFEDLKEAQGIRCQSCYGTGLDRYEEVDCMSCWGEGVVYASL